ncbi:PNPase/RNase PH domain containing protein [Babesia gibsoni]|uniref:Ribosomal RNA-processing protein 42 n=1 Tax=Babesia gibsoni TaxID=33632 RepID=A0AAD8P9F1_BABGI|nr:PNPase/RNase PH domain containing protein [Babesia gibsoni]
MDFIRNAIASNCRLDGRQLDAQPDLQIEPHVSSLAHGSCRVTLDDTVVITTVTFALTSPLPDAPDEGILEISLGSPFTLEDPEISQNREECTEKLLEMMQFTASRFDKRLLCVYASQFVWSLKVHSTILQKGGTPFDAISIATLVALRTASIPNLDVILRDEMERSKSGTNVRVTVSEGYNMDMKKLALQLPVCVTATQIAGVTVWGSTKEEAECSDGCLTVAVAPDGKCLGMKVNGSCFSLPCIGEISTKSCNIGMIFHQQAEQALLLRKLTKVN